MKNFKMMESANQQMEAVNELLIQLLWCQLHAVGCLDKDFVWKKGTLSFYPKWLVESIAMLQAQVQFLPVDTDRLIDTNLYKQMVNTYWEKWDQQLTSWLQNPDLQAQVKLVDRMLRSLPSILHGDKLATEIMFPESSMHLVEGIYKYHSTADYFNTVLAESVSTYVEKCAQAGKKVRILEIGAGTGGTSEVVFEHLKVWERHIQEYVYSDISKAFLMHAEQKYGPSVPYLNYQIIDLKKSFASQDVDLGAYDLIIASNVLHTTKNIRHTLQTVKTALKKNGMLLVNEITDKSLINHLTFGLLEGWWAYEDEALRISGSPALSVDSWKKILKREGFHSITYPASEALMFKQQVIASQSDGIVIHAKHTVTEVDVPLTPPPQHIPTQQPGEHADISAVTDQSVYDFVSDIVRGSIAEDLKISTDRIQNNRSFAEYGVDSIIAVHLVNVINKRGQLSLQTTVLFDYNNVDLLVEYLLEEHSAHFKQMLQNIKESSEDNKQVPTVEKNTTPQKLDTPIETLKDSNTDHFSSEHHTFSENYTKAQNVSASSFYQVVLHRPSDIQELSIQAQEVPALKEDEVRIAVRAFSLNFGDLLSVKGMYPTMPPYPFTPGFEASGIVVDVGDRVTHIHAGEEVVFFASEHMGAHATAITCKASQVFVKPSALSFAEACSLPVVAMTVIAAFRKVQIKPKQRILIQTATGGVGLIAIQLAKHYGAEIYATAGSQHKLDYLLSIGVDHVINYREVDFEQQIRQLTNGQGVDMILNTLSGDALQKGLNSLASNGSYIEIAMTALKSAKAIDLSQMGSNQSFYSLDLRKLSLEQPERLVDYYQEMVDWIEKGVIVPHIGQLFRFDQLQAAYRNIENRENIGKIVVTIPEEWQYQGSPQNDPVPSSNQDRNSREPIAIIGISGRFAGCNTPDELWEHLQQGTDLIQSVSRWDLSSYYDKDKQYCDQGSFLDDISTFDPLFFNISGQEAIYMDPQQRIFLEESWKALEDAGYAGHSIKEQKCGVYVGCTSSDYQTLVGENPPPQSFWGKAGSIIPARIAYYLDLQGPAIAVDTACSSSLVAIHLACQALWGNEINMALAGGVFLQSTPQFYLDSNRAGMLSLQGKCHTFDERADGFVPGEGAGTIVLKRLQEAINDGDHIYGVIQGSGINQDGTTNGITAPSAKSQTRLEQQVYDSFAINPAHIQMVEAHGTGTKLGDPIEYQALTKAFSAYTNEQQYCAIGSIKTNIGHLATAAGIAGVLKIVLSLKNKQIPASLHLEHGNPGISFADSPFYVNTATKDWEVPSGQVRRAAISSFGFSGTNAHMVIEEAPQHLQPFHVSKAGYLIVLSARTEQQLRLQAQQLLYWNMNHTADCAAISYTLLSGRQHLNHRLACIVHNQQELTTCLQQWLEQGQSSQVTVGQVNRSENREQLSFKKYAEDCIQKCQQSRQDPSYLEYLSAVKEVFIQGYDGNMGDIFVKKEQQRIPLPTYPFAKNQYWVPTTPAQQKGFTSSQAVVVESIHPLMHRNTSDLQQQKYSSTFTGNEFFFQDHIVQGDKVLPGVAHLEWIRIAVTEAVGGIAEDQMIQLKNIVWASPLRLEVEPFIAHIDLYVESNGELSFEIYSDATANRERLVYSQGSASIIDNTQPVAIDIADLQHQYSINPISAKQFYEQSQKNGIALGNSLKGIEVVYTKTTNDHDVLARLKMPVSQLPDQESYQLHPSMMDSALQVAIGYTIGTVSNPAYQGKSTLPFTLQKLEIFQPCLPEMWVWARYSAGSTANDKVHKLDIDLCDDERNVCVRFHGFTARTLEHTVTSSSHHHDSVLLTPTWTEYPVISDLQDSVHNDKNIHHIVVLSPPFAARYEEIRTQFPDVHCVILQEEEVAYLTEEEQNAHLFTSCTVQLIDLLKQSLSTSSEKILLQLIVPNKGKYQMLLGLAATLQTAQQEYSKLQAHCIQMNLQETATGIISKIKQNRHESVAIVRYEDEIRYVRDWKKWESPLSNSPQILWKDQGHYLITGGLGGLGFIFAQEIIQQTHQATIIIVGRSPLDHVMQEKLDQLQDHQAQIHYIVADITIAEDVNTMMYQIRSICGELHGIIHSAGVHRDHYIQHKVNEEIEEVLAPKVQGTLLLDQVSAEMQLDFFVLFSSLASVIGNPGQADYAAANAFIDLFASERNRKVIYQQRSGKTLSLNFPLWEDGGMQVNTAERTRIQNKLGMIPMDTATGMQLFYQAMQSQQDQVVVMYGDTDKLQSLLQPARSKRLTKQDTSTVPHNDQDTSIQEQSINTKAETNQTILIEKMQSALIHIVSHMLKVSPKDIYPDVELSEYGFDSISFTDFSNQLNDKYQLDLTPTVFFEYSTIYTLARHLITSYSEQLTSIFMPNVQRKTSVASDSAKVVNTELDQKVKSTKSEAIAQARSRFQKAAEPVHEPVSSTETDQSLDPVAIIGISGRFPMADDIHELWENLIEGKDCISEIPADRWDWKAYYGDPYQEKNKTNIKWGSFIDGVADFDPMFFGISPREAELMDPQQRLMMMYIWKAIEDAGYAPSTLSGSKMGIFVGTANSGYSHLLSQADTEIEGYSSTGSVSSVGPNRMSFFLNVNGPSEPIETACSSSLVALHRAVQAIHNGDCDTAVVGGVNTILDPDYHISFNKAGMLSQDGRCKTFSDQVNGYVRGEGVGMIFVKRLKDAEQAGDHIYGLIRGTNENHGGRATSLTAPNPRAQADLIKSVYSRAHIDPATISYIEAHGTGTPLGDPIEINGLKMAFNELGYDATLNTATCGLGSIKTNIGHLELAAGIAGIIKVLLQMKYKTLVKTVHFEQLNPYIQLDQSPFYVVDTNRPWTPLEDQEGNILPRRAGVSSFGFGGVNTHVLVEEYIFSSTDQVIATRYEEPVCIVLSARTEQRLREQAKQLRTAMQSDQYTDHELERIAYTLQVGREAMEERLAMRVSSINELVTLLNKYIEQDDSSWNEDIYTGQVKRDQEVLEFLTADEDMQETVQRWLEKGKYHKLLKLWVKGMDIDWSTLYIHRSLQRISLPTYAFERTRYWIPNRSKVDSNSYAIANSSHMHMIHPLLHHNTSTLTQQRFTSTFTGEEFFLKDHVIKGQKILPGVAYLEMVRASVVQAMELTKHDLSMIVLQNVTWVRPIAVDQQPVQIHIQLIPQENQLLNYEIYSQQEDMLTTLYSQGTVTVVPTEKEYKEINIASLVESCDQHKITAAECYASFQQVGLSYGPAQQAIQNIYIGHQQAIAQLLLPSTVSHTAEQYILHPSMMDAAIQACIGLPSLGYESVTPFALDQMNIYQPCTSKMWVWVRYQDTVEHQSSLDKVDIDLYNEHGQICIEIKGLNIIHLSPNQDQLQHTDSAPSVGALMQYPVWDSVIPEYTASHMESSTHILCIGESPALWLNLIQDYPHIRYAQLAIDADVEQIVALLEKEPAIDHIIWSVPNTVQLDLLHVPVQQPAKGILQVFRILKSLLQLGYGEKDLSWTIVTAQTQSLSIAEKAYAEHAGIAGLVGSMAKEYSNWNIHHVDLEENMNVVAHDILTLPVDPEGNTWMYREHQWYRQQLMVVDAKEESSTYFQQNGVYVVIGGAGGIGEVWSQYMIQTYNAQMIWIGRRPLNSQIQDKIDRLGQQGIAPLYITADASDLQSLTEAYRMIKQSYSSINGIIHSAVGIMDASLSHMEEDHFQNSLSAKIDISLAMMQVFAKEPLDIVLFFSSMSSFSKPIGQSSYAAGCTFTDTFAHEMRRAFEFPIKVMSWGYWGDIGIAEKVPSAFKQRLIQSGIGFIEPSEAMQAVEYLVGNPIDHMAFIHTTQPDAVLNTHSDEKLWIAPKVEAVAIESLQRGHTDDSKVNSLIQTMQIFDRELETLLAHLLYVQLQQAQCLEHNNNIVPVYERWLESSRWILKQKNIDDSYGAIEQMWSQWQQRKEVWSQHPDLQAQVVLVDTMLKHLPDIIQGKVLATDIMFPDASMSLLENLYKNNAVADYFNEKLADTIVSYIQARLQNDPSASIRILEAGAGTGGTSAIVLKKLKPYTDSIAEYAYTDLSKAFLNRAEMMFGQDYPYLNYQLFNIEKPAQEQSLAIGSYDIVIAANVLHATQNIKRTSKHIHSLLKQNGLLLLNELNRSTLFSHLTFGLLEGWWMYEDASIRIPGSPILDQHHWRNTLEYTGFHTVTFPAQYAEPLGQQIVVAASHGLIRLPRSQSSNPIYDSKNHKAEERVQTIDTTSTAKEIYHSQEQEQKQEKIYVSAKPATPEPITEEILLQHSKPYFQQLIGELVKLPYEQIDISEPLEKYGIDSILIVQLTNKLRKHFDPISSTLFFEHQSLVALIQYFIKEHQQQLIELLEIKHSPATTVSATASFTNDSSQVIADKNYRPLKMPVQEVKAPESIAPEPTVSQSKVSPIGQSVVSVQPTPPISQQEPIAIIGMSGRYPQADNLEQYWHNLEHGIDCISEIPEERWSIEGFYNADRKRAAAQGQSYSKWGGFINGFADFDPLFFKLSPREAINMDPQERIFLQSVWESLEDAGHTRQKLAEHYHSKVGVFAGITKTGYNLYGPELWKQGSDLFPMTSFSSVANRVSYLLDLYGPSKPVDTMCSSSLTAIHEACESIRSGACELAIAGGVNLYLHPSNYIGLCAQQMLAADHKCKSFAEQADGFVPGEGVGVLLLKPLSKAIADGDAIHAIIRGTGINHGGKTNGYMVPNPTAQANLIRDTMDQAGIHAEEISYIEAHGTGTSLGDPIEVSGLTKAFRIDTQQQQYCAIGSVKSNMGHLESAAGIAGVTKIILQMKHQKIVPTLHASTLNPEIPFAQTPFVVQQHLSDWKRPHIHINGQSKEVPRIAGISSFGAGGSNAHVILEEYIAQQIEQQPQSEPIDVQPTMIILSARQSEQLIERARQLLAFVESTVSSEVSLADIAYTLQVGREAMEERIAWIVHSIADLKEKLSSFIQQPEDSSIHNYQGTVKRLFDITSVFDSEEHMQQIVNEHYVNGQYDVLLKLWIQGAPIRWNKLNRSVTSHIIHLPAYPFAKEKYWLAPAQMNTLLPEQKVHLNEGKVMHHTALHPLLHRNTSQLSEQRFTSIFSGQEFFFADHVVNEASILPGVAYLEMVREAIAQSTSASLDHNMWSLENIIWATPIRIEETELAVHVALYAEDENHIQYEVYTEKGTARTIHSQGRAVKSSLIDAPELDLSHIQQSMTEEILPSTCYKQFEQMGLHYGDRLQSITSLQLGTKGVLARLNLPATLEDSFSSYLLHPSMMDGALQASIGLIFSDNTSAPIPNRPRLPFALEQIRIFSACSTSMWSYIRYSEGSDPMDKVQKLDIDICHENGEICASLKGFTSKRLEYSEASSYPKETVMLVPEWLEQDIVTVPEISFQQHMIMICSPSAHIAEQVRQELPEALCIQLGCHESLPLEQRFGKTALEAFTQVQQLLQSKPEGSILVQLVVVNDQDYQLYTALSAMLKTAELEKPQLIVQMIELDALAAAFHPVDKLCECRDSAGDTHISYHNHQRYISTWQEFVPNATSVKQAWKDRNVYLITGGMGGIGYLIAQDIAQTVTEPILIMTGRSRLDKDIQIKLDTLQAYGAQAFYYVSDIANKEEVSALMNTIRMEFGQLNGIIHSAGVLKDSFMIRKTPEEWNHVLAAKVNGTLYLDQYSQSFELDFFVLFSSLAGVLGNIGQSDYATANAFMDQYAHYRNKLVYTAKRTGHTLSINWPLWEEGGMQMDTQSTSSMKQMSGMLPIDHSTAIHALQQALEHEQSQIVVMYGNGAQIRSFMDVDKGIEIDVQDKYFLELFDHIQSGQYSLEQLVEQHNQTKPF
ncbi:SDR family NAD(P)-dependent oxidoreductase [Paenibacillus sp. KACC 21273]|uniref:SDR family NAD(P)-dependent oxidoreductase n=1 Tax=Paenibacillus sp. KACC 21273 TaxID=3025665 RepID=UPI002365521D|nr:SDR family NAD(P)-dependent oxidoreductase [Paenibacillus sp. KACC 21273]WDF48900.1 SDR family NAD(P)-dependent oxidoreductase [Paenibacillus sp. KACC 21273]